MAEIFAPLTTSNLTNQTSITTNIDNNFKTVSTLFGDTLSRSGATPNQMISELDMNSNQIINLPSPSTPTSPVRLQDISSTLVPTPAIISGSNVYTGNNSFTGVTTLGPKTILGTGTGLVLYVSTTGNDGNDGLTLGTALATLKQAVNVAAEHWGGNGNINIVLGQGNFPGTEIGGLFAGTSGAIEVGCELIITGDSAATTNITTSTTVGASWCLEISNCPLFVVVNKLNFDLPNGSGYGVFVQNCSNFSIGTNVAFTCNNVLNTAIHAEAFSQISNFGTPLVFLGSSCGTAIALGPDAEWQCSGNISVSCNLTNFLFSQSSVTTILGSPTITVGPGVITTLYDLFDGSIIVDDSTIFNAGSSTFLGSISGGSSKRPVVPVTVASSTGIGSTGTTTFSIGSGCTQGIITLTPSGSGIASTGAITLNVPLVPLMDADVSTYAPYICNPGNTAWNVGTYIASENLAVNQMTIAWNNNGVNLSSGTPYIINYAALS